MTGCRNLTKKKILLLGQKAILDNSFLLLLLLLFSCLVVSDSSATPWTKARQAPLSMGSSRQEYWSSWSFPSPGDLPDSGTEPRSPVLQADSLSTEPPKKPHTHSFPGVLSDKDPACQCRRCKRRGFDPWVRKIPWRIWQPTPAFLPGESPGQRSLAGYSPWSCRELDMTEAT